MRLAEAVESYVARKRSEGLLFVDAGGILAGLSRKIGDLPLERIRTDHILAFLNSSSSASTGNWRRKHHALRRFFEFFAERRQMPSLDMPLIRCPVPNQFTSYIYSRWVFT